MWNEDHVENHKAKLLRILCFDLLSLCDGRRQDNIFQQSIFFSITIKHRAGLNMQHVELIRFPLENQTVFCSLCLPIKSHEMTMKKQFSSICT